MKDKSIKIAIDSKTISKAIHKNKYQMHNNDCLMDDIIIVTGSGLKNHKKKLFNCLDSLNEENLAISLNKCRFAKERKNMPWLRN